MASNGIEDAAENAMDDRPIAVRRKRRSSSRLADPGASATNLREQSSDTVDPSAADSIQTPTKPKKRVRFSDPGPNSSLEASSTSTGLTPALKRTSFIQHPATSTPVSSRLLAAKPRRRRSAPEPSSVLPSPSLSPPATAYISGEIQFAPLRQVLDERSKRRIKRSHMSEEMNEIEMEQGARMSKPQMRQTIMELQNQLAAAKQLCNEDHDNVKLEVGNEERVRELEQELEGMKQALRARSTTAEPANAENREISQEESDSSIYQDDADRDFVTVTSDEAGVLRDSTHLHVAVGGSADASSQASLMSDAEDDAFRSARISLEHLFPGETALGLQIEDPAPLLNTMLERIRTLKTRVLIAEDAVSTTKTQEANLRNQFNAMLAQLTRARNYAEVINEQTRNEKSRADKAEEQSRVFQADLQRAEATKKELEAEVDEKQRSVLKLQDALESYREEVGKLEVLITSMESEHNNEISELRAEMDEAVADLECNVASETLGRRAAEKEAVERGERLRQLEHLEQELRDAMNDKQRTIRELEAALAKAHQQKEQEVGSLNVEVGSIATSLEGAKGELNTLKAEKSVLLFRIEEEKAAGIKAVEAIQAEMARCVEKMEEVKESHKKDMQSRGAEVTEHKGLLTPVSATRFKDVPGYVEVKRGKRSRGRRGDSGVAIPEEDEDEDEGVLNSDL
ncbi:MAG: hypothetical protein Q9191_008028 [Dirinaria sp. TL-2023a]